MLVLILSYYANHTNKFVAQGLFPDYGKYFPGQMSLMDDA